MSGNLDRNVDCDWLLLVDCKEIHVQASVSYRVELELVKNSGVLLSVEVEVNYIGARSVGDGLEFLCIYCEENVLESETVEIARNESLCAEGLDGSLVANQMSPYYKSKQFSKVLEKVAADQIFAFKQSEGKLKLITRGIDSTSAALETLKKLQ